MRYWSTFFNIIPLFVLMEIFNFTYHGTEVRDAVYRSEAMIAFCGVIWNCRFFSERLFLSSFITESWKLQIWQIMAISLNCKCKKVADLASTFISLPHKMQNSPCGLTLYFIREYFFCKPYSMFALLPDPHLGNHFNTKRKQFK